MLEVRTEVDGERFGDPGAPPARRGDPKGCPEHGASASCIRERAAEELNPQIGRMGAEDPAAVFRPDLRAGVTFWAEAVRIEEDKWR
jgi:hypothetical protein